MVLGARAAWTSDLEEHVRRRLRCEASGHDPWHAFRVRDIAVKIAAAIGADADIVEAAALLHDIGHETGRADHASRGANLAAEILSSCRFPSEKACAVTTCIEHHHWQPGRAGDPQEPMLEYQAFADADRLDALGAIGIARTFAFGGAHQRPIWRPEPGAEADRSTIQHFYDKLLRLPADMYTEPGRRLAGKRVTVMQEFLEIFYREWKGLDVEIASTLIRVRPE